MRLRNLQNGDSFERIQQTKVCLEDILGLPTDPGDYYEDAKIIAVKCEQTFEAASTDVSMKAMQKERKRPSV